MFNSDDAGTWRARAAHARPHQRGFVLVLVLVTMAAISAGALTLASLASSTDEATVAALSAAKARAAAEAAVARTLAHIAAADDAHAVLERRSVWSFAGFQGETTLESESGKVDLNAGDAALASAFLAAVGLRATSRALAEDRMRRARAEGVPVPNPIALLPPCDRLGAASVAMTDFFTVLTRANGVSPRAMEPARLALVPTIVSADLAALQEDRAIGRAALDDERLKHLHRYFADESSFSTVRVKLAGADIADTERRVVLFHERGERLPRIVETETRALVVGSLCD
jgi:Tfp pilus assembly protein PilV